MLHDLGVLIARAYNSKRAARVMVFEQIPDPLTGKNHRVEFLDGCLIPETPLPHTGPVRRGEATAGTRS
jgi:hypothetical protein